jgi:OmpA-like transmembrane domain
MSKIALRKLFKPAPVLAAALSIVSLSAVAQEAQSSPWGVYMGGSYGIGVNTRPCNGLGDRDLGGCERAATAGKLFGGYRMTPGLALEAAYFYFGSQKKYQGPGNPLPAVGQLYDANYKDRAHGYSLGINWEVELLGNFTNHLRIGFGRVRLVTDGSTSTVTSTTPTYTYATRDDGSNYFTNVPYVGAGLSGKLNDYLRLFTAADLFINGHKSLLMLGAGVSVEY